MFTIEEKIRYSELSHTGRLSLYGIVNLFQDCATLHSEAVGYPVERHLREGNAWFINSWQVIASRYPRGGERVRVSTWATKFEHFTGVRNFQLTTEDGEVLSYANSIWTLMDTRAMRPMRVPEEMGNGYGIDAPLDMDYAPRKIRTPKEWKDERTFVVPRSFIDTNGHMNNGRYVEAALEYVPDPEKIRQMRVEFKAPAMQGETIRPQTASADGRFYVQLCRDDGRAYAVIELTQANHEGKWRNL